MFCSGPRRRKDAATLLSLAVLCVLSVTAQEVEKDIPTIAREALKAVVTVVVFDEAGKQIGQGSGFVVRSDGRVVTNYHVIEHAASAEIKFRDGSFYEIDGVLASDPNRDIAVLKVKASGKDFPFLPLGDSDRVEIGEQVVAIGSPLRFEGTVSNGIISAIREANDLPLGRVRDIIIFQTTAPISKGNSGGPLFNLDGEVIAIPTFFYARGQNLNFAVPIKYVIPLLNSTSLTPLTGMSATSSPRQTEFGTLADLAGTYLGVWQSGTYPGSGAAVMTVSVAGETVSARVILTGSPIGYKGDTLRMKATKLGSNIWTVEFKGEHSALSGTGIFKEGQFLGDYRYRRVRRFVRDYGQWILKKQ